MEDREYVLCPDCNQNYWSDKEDVHRELWHTYKQNNRYRHTDYGIAGY